jgi:hypothetical protein
VDDDSVSAATFDLDTPGEVAEATVDLSPTSLLSLTTEDNLASLENLILMVDYSGEMPW